jgi:hypothetical protein
VLSRLSDLQRWNLVDMNPATDVGEAALLDYA